MKIYPNWKIKINHKLKKYKNNSTKLLMRMINLLHYLSNKYKVVSLYRIIITIMIMIMIIKTIIIIIIIILEWLTRVQGPWIFLDVCNYKKKKHLEFSAGFARTGFVMVIWQIIASITSEYPTSSIEYNSSVT